MKFADRHPTERTAISAWIRVRVRVREDACLYVADDFKAAREKAISEYPGDIGKGDIEKMLRFYTAYQQARPSVSYTEYFQVTNPEEYAAILAQEKQH